MGEKHARKRQHILFYGEKMRVKSEEIKNSRLKYKVIVIEDDFDHRELLSISLKMVGLNDILFLTNEKEINQYFFQSKDREPAKPTLIFLDIRLPKINGLDILKKLKKDPYWGNAKIIILSCSERLEDRNQAEQFGADNYIVKPISIKQIEELINKNQE